MSDAEIVPDMDADSPELGGALDRGESPTEDAWAPPPGALPEGAKPSKPVAIKGIKGETKEVPVAPPTAGRSAGWGKRGIFKTLVFSLTLVLSTFLVVAWLNSKGDARSQMARIFLGVQQGRNALETVVKGIESARGEIMIAASDINNRSILDALAVKREEGVEVLVVLDPMHPKSNQVRNYLLDRGFSPSRVLIHNRQLNTQLVIIDRAFVLVGTLPFNQGAVEQTSDLMVLHNPKLAEQYRKSLGAVLTQG